MKFYVVKSEILSKNNYYDDKQLLLYEDNRLHGRFISSAELKNINLNCYNITTDEDLIFDAVISEYESKTEKTLNDDLLFNSVKDNLLKFAEKYIFKTNLKKYEV